MRGAPAAVDSRFRGNDGNAGRVGLMLATLYTAEVSMRVPYDQPSRFVQRAAISSVAPSRTSATSRHRDLSVFGGRDAYHPPSVAASTSLTRTRPPEPVPFTLERSTPSSLARRCAATVTFGPSPPSREFLPARLGQCHARSAALRGGCGDRCWLRPDPRAS